MLKSSVFRLFQRWAAGPIGERKRVQRAFLEGGCLVLLAFSAISDAAVKAIAAFAGRELCFATMGEGGPMRMGPKPLSSNREWITRKELRARPAGCGYC